MCKAENWAHYQPNILVNCATAHGEPAEDAEDPELAKQMIEAADPYEPMLKPITDDQPVRCSEKISQPAWSVRLQGDSTDYKNANGSGTSNFGVVVVRSLLWPGAYTFFKNGVDYQIYLGCGHKFEQQKPGYFPV